MVKLKVAPNGRVLCPKCSQAILAKQTIVKLFVIVRSALTPYSAMPVEPTQTSKMLWYCAFCNWHTNHTPVLEEQG